MSSKRKALVCLAMAWAALGAFAGAEPQPTIEILQVPSELSFPMPSHANAILTVRVPAQNARQVWLSTSPDFPGRVMLRAIGDGKYQINLADEVVYRILQADDKAQKFYVYAEDTKGTTTMSLGLSFRLSGPGAGKVGREKIRVVTQSGDAAGKEGVRHFSAHMGRAWRPWPVSVWVAPGYTTRVWVYCDKEYAAAFRSAEKTWPMTGAGEGWAYFALTEEASERVRRTGKARVEYELEVDGRKGGIDLKVAPAELKLPPKGAGKMIAEYGAATVQGSSGYLEVSVGRIGGYRTTLSLKGADGREFIPETVVTRAFKEPFDYGGKRYLFAVTAITQSVFGEDFLAYRITEYLREEAPASAPASQPAK